MKQIEIKNWRSYGDYMYFSNLADLTNEKIMLSVVSNTIHATGSKFAIDKLIQLLEAKKIVYSL